MEKKHSEKGKASLDLTRPKLNRNMIVYHETGDLFADTCEIVESAQSIAYAAVDTILVQRNWLLGKRIAIECLDENGKADYGKKTMKKLSAELKEKYGKGFDFSSLYKYVKFHQEFPQILDSLSPQTRNRPRIVQPSSSCLLYFSRLWFLLHTTPIFDVPNGFSSKLSPSITSEIAACGLSKAA